jgi:hypothetical protein
MTVAAIAAYAAATGFVSAGLLASFYQLMTTEPPRFRVAETSIVAGTLSVILCMFAGPFMLMRVALFNHGALLQSAGSRVVAGLLASGWSFCSGVVVLQFVLALRSTLA